MPQNSSNQNYCIWNVNHSESFLTIIPWQAVCYFRSNPWHIIVEIDSVSKYSEISFRSLDRYYFTKNVSIFVFFKWGKEETLSLGRGTFATGFGTTIEQNATPRLCKNISIIIINEENFVYKIETEFKDSVKDEDRFHFSDRSKDRWKCKNTIYGGREWSCAIFFPSEIKETEVSHLK